MGDDLSLSLRAACGVMAGDGLGDNAMSAALQSLKASGLIRDGRVMLSDLNRAVRALNEEAA